MTKNTTKKKSPETIKQELLTSIIEIVNEEGYSGLNEEVKNAKEPNIDRIINIVGKQGELLKKFKESDEFFSRVGLSRSNIYLILFHDRFT